MPATGTYPALSVQFAPGIAASAVPSSGDWVDVTTYVKSMDIKYGREDEFSQPSAGSLHVELDNGYRADVVGAAYQAGGRFDPDNASSPWATQLLPLVWFRVLGGATVANADVFYGQASIEGWRLSASQFAHSTVSVDVLDMFEQMANTDLPASVYEIEVRADASRAWYRLGESTGTVATDSSGNGHDATYEGGATFNTRPGLIALASDNAIFFPYSGVAGVRLNGLPLSYPFTIEAWIQTTDAATASTVTTFFASRTLVDIEGGSAGWLRLTVIADDDIGAHPGAVAVEVVNGSTGYLSYSAVKVNDGAVHHVVVVGTNDTTSLAVYVDGVDVTTASVATGASWPLPAASDALLGSGLNTVFAGFGGVIDEVAFYSSALSSGRIAAHCQAGSAPWDGDVSGARVTHLLDAAAFPSSLRTVATGASAVQAASIEADLLSAVQAVAKAERGELYIDHADGGKVRFRGRQDRWTATASISSQATFGDGVGEVPYSAIDIQDDRIINRVTVQRSGGSTILAHDATSEAKYQRRTYGESGLLFKTDAEAQYRADLIVSEKKDRKRRVRSITLEPRASTHLAWGQVFARRIGDRITVKWRPAYGGTYSYLCYVEGIRHEWNQQNAAWRTVLSLSPAPAVDFFVLDSATLGVLDTNRLAY